MTSPHNNGCLTGGIVADPEIFKDKVAKLRIAVDFAGTDAKNKDDRTGYFDAVFFLNDDNPNSKFASRMIREGKVKKGSQISVVYSLRQERFEDKDGNRRNSITLVVDSLTFAGGNTNSENTGGGTTATTASANTGGNDAPSMIDEF